MSRIIREVLPAEKIKLIMWANANWLGEDGHIIPIRRVLSLARLSGCKTMVVEQKKWVSGQCLNGESRCLSCYPRSPESCDGYVKNITENYGYSGVHKNCCRLSFFKSEFEHEELNEQINKNFLGYAIIHTDIFRDTKKKRHKVCYITESVLQSPFSREETVFGSHSVDVKINGKKFSVEGNYFSQQNGITNSCANAAIKMGYRAYFPGLTAENINEKVKVDHVKKEGCKGLSPEQIKEAIKHFTGRESYWLRSMDYGIDNFYKILYHAIESRFPVLLVFNVPGSEGKGKNKKNKGKQGGQSVAHTVTLIGHTLNKHNWWSYGLKMYDFPSLISLPIFSMFFTTKNNYLSSFTWCNSFVAHDDNMGPYYSLPTLPQPPSNVRWLDSLINVIYRIAPSFARKHARHAIISYPKSFEFFKDTVDVVEPMAADFLQDVYTTLADNELLLKRNTYFKNYFIEPFLAERLIFRSFVLDKTTYLDSACKYEGGEYLSLFKDILPDNFWITEISIPEMFWVNRQKIGEIICVPIEKGGRYYLKEKMAIIPGVIATVPKNDDVTMDVFEFPCDNKFGLIEIVQKTVNIETNK